MIVTKWEGQTTNTETTKSNLVQPKVHYINEYENIFKTEYSWKFQTEN